MKSYDFIMISCCPDYDLATATVPHHRGGAHPANVVLASWWPGWPGLAGLAGLAGWPGLGSLAGLAGWPGWPCGPCESYTIYLQIVRFRRRFLWHLQNRTRFKPKSHEIVYDFGGGNPKSYEIVRFHCDFVSKSNDFMTIS